MCVRLTRVGTVWKITLFRLTYLGFCSFLLRGDWPSCPYGSHLVFIVGYCLSRLSAALCCHSTLSSPLTPLSASKIVKNLLCKKPDFFREIKSLKNEKLSLTEKIFRQNNSSVTSTVKPLLSRNFCQNRF